MGLFDKYRKNNLNESKDWSAAMKNNNANIDRLARLRTQVNIDPVMEEVIDSTEKADKNAKEVFTKLAKDASSIIPKDPGTGKKITIKPYTEKLTLDENLFKESWTSFGGSWRDQTVKRVNYEEEDISDIAYELMNWYGEYFEGWEGPDIKDALYGLDGERIPGSDCPIIFTMEESEEDDWDEDEDEEYDESWNAKGSFENQSVKSVTYEEDDISDIAEELMNWYGEYFEDWEAADIKDALYGLYGERIPGSDCPIIFTMEESDEDEYDWGSDNDDEEYDESFSSKNQRCFIIRDKESGDYDRICGISYNDALRKARIKKYEVDFIGEEDEEYDESLEKKSLKDLNLLEYVNEEDVEDDDYTVYDLLNDRLFGYGINKSNFRVKWKFAEVEPTVKTRDGKLKRGYFYPTIHQDELTTGKSDDRRAFTEDGIGVFVHDEDEASLAKKCAEELDLDFVMKKLVRPHNGFNYIATIKVSDDIQEMPIKDYMESIGKSMSDILRGKGDKIKSNFKDSKNYQSRKTNKEQQETAE